MYFGKIKKNNDGDKVFELVLNGTNYGFNVDYLKTKKDEEWFIDVVCDQMLQIYDQGKHDERKRIKGDLKPLKDLLV